MPPLLLAGLSATALLFPGAQEKPSQPAPQPSAQQPALRQRLQPILRARFPASGEPPALPVAGGSFRAAPDLSCFYDRRSYAPAWIGDQGVRPDADDLIAALADAPADGLDPERYRLADLRQRLAQAKGAPTPGDLAEIDLRLTDAFLRLAADLRNGAVNPQLIYPDCELDIPEVDLSAVLEDALAAGRLRPAIAELAPAHDGYRALKAALAQCPRASPPAAAGPPCPTARPCAPATATPGSPPCAPASKPRGTSPADASPPEAPRPPRRPSPGRPCASSRTGTASTRRRRRQGHPGGPRTCPPSGGCGRSRSTSTAGAGCPTTSASATSW